MTLRFCALAVVLLLSLTACGDSNETAAPPDTGPATDTVSGTDAATDDGRDAAATGPDTATEPDTATDIAADVGPTEPAPVVTMTFNVLCSFCDPTNYDPWDDRLPYFADIFARHDPDLVGLQELTFPQEVDEIVTAVTDATGEAYEAVYYVEEGDAFRDWPDATILYRSSRFTLLDHGTFWLSPTPDVPGSIGFSEPQFARLVVWARLHDDTNDADLLFVTTHFDNNPPSQELSAPLLLERLGPRFAELPSIVTGDFNSQPEDEAYRILVEGEGGEGAHLTDAFTIAETWSVVTNQTPPPDYPVEGRIDHVFVAGADWRCPRWEADLTVYGPEDRYPSDHWPIVAELVWE